MNSIEEIIKKIQNNINNLNFINEILIELSQDPKPTHFKAVDYLLKNVSKENLRRININLVYLLGQLGTLFPLNQNCIDFLFTTFYNSDRWIRSEVLNSLEKNIDAVKENDKFLPLLSSAMNEEYENNVINALKVLLKLKEMPPTLFKSFLVVLNKDVPNFKEYLDKILKKYLKEESIIFNLLNEDKNYLMLKTHGFRLILQSFVLSVQKIDSFQALIKNSDWEPSIKSMFLKEINIVQNLIKSI